MVLPPPDRGQGGDQIAYTLLPWWWGKEQSETFSAASIAIAVAMLPVTLYVFCRKIFPSVPMAYSPTDESSWFTTYRFSPFGEATRVTGFRPAVIGESASGVSEPI